MRALSPGTMRTPGNERETVTSGVERFTLAAFVQLHHLLPRPPMNAEARRRRGAEGRRVGAAFRMVAAGVSPAVPARR